MFLSARRILTLAPVCLAALGLGCGGGKDGGTVPKLTPAVECDRYLHCISAVEPSKFTTELKLYDKDSPCWKTTAASTACKEICSKAYAQYATKFPGAPACGAKPDAGLSLDQATRDLGSPDQMLPDIKPDLPPGANSGKPCAKSSDCQPPDDCLYIFSGTALGMCLMKCSPEGSPCPAPKGMYSVCYWINPLHSDTHCKYYCEIGTSTWACPNGTQCKKSGYGGSLCLP